MTCFYFNIALTQESKSIGLGCYELIPKRMNPMTWSVK